MLYSKTGKYGKIFGPDDNDALKILKKFCSIQFISSDKRGFSISKKRIFDDMKFKLTLVTNDKKTKWFKNMKNLNNIIYMGDGIYDHEIFELVGLGIAFKDSLKHVKNKADIVINRVGSNRAVAEASIYILKKYFSYKKF